MTTRKSAKTKASSKPTETNEEIGEKAPPVPRIAPLKHPNAAKFQVGGPPPIVDSIKEVKGLVIIHDV